MQISGVVILYHPNEEEVIRNIQTYIEHIDALIVFDNSHCGKAFIERIKSVSSKIVVIQNERNEGIAKPLNKALKLVSNKSTWLLTMDQDSYFEPRQASAFFDSFKKIFYTAEDVAVVCPNHAGHSDSVSINNEYSELIGAITSGSIINTRVCEKLNGFEEKLFIDYVDFEYCYRCFMAGFKIFQFHNIYLNHCIGTRKQAGYFSVIKRSDRSIHSPFRIYFMVRNFSYVSKKYKTFLSQEIKQRRRELFVILKNNLLFSRNFFRVIFAIFKGYLHYKRNKFSS